MKKNVKLNIRFICLLTALAILLMGNFAPTVYAAGVETWERGYVYNVGGFTFTNTNTTPTKTINGENLSLILGWKKASTDRGIGDVKLTVQILDSTTGNPLTSKLQYYFEDDGSGYSWVNLTLSNLNYGQKIKIWFDASSVGSSNGNYRSIEIKTFSAAVS